NCQFVCVRSNSSAAAPRSLAPALLRGARGSGAAISRFREAREARGPVPIELAYRQSDGTLHTLEGQAIAIDDPDEERYAFVVEDVRELRQLQTGLIRADRLASLGTLSASIGHEIGTSAAVALGQLELTTKLLERGGPPEAVIEGLGEVRTALLRAVGVLRDMRALALGATFGSEASDVDSAIDIVKDVLRPDLARLVTLHETRLAGARVAMSHSRLVQVLLNFVRNAIEAFGERLGTLWIEVSRPGRDRVRVEVADDGPGLTAAVRERLFEPFLSTKAEGTGLGLYVCRLLATAAGGSIEAVARDGGGTCLRLEVPSADAL
ncbi:MAG TPA: ATP-binding protein, partial [Labilithrix sp.]|nr:ATP-binding protein [Labilithrix sp.]